MKRIAVISLFALVLVNTAYGAETSATNRPAHWAKPIQIKGAPNLHKVSDTLYRSAQPSAEGIRNLKAMGIETVVDLRSFHSDRDEIGETGLAYEHIYMKAWHPEEEEAVRFLQIVTNPKRTPVLVHCQHGADRTGTICVLFRVAVQGWSKEEALKEMTQGGFGFHGIWKISSSGSTGWISKASRRKQGSSKAQNQRLIPIFLISSLTLLHSSQAVSR
jgi:protein tyrosine phosphatase (PTP) superfamily phosphohydrolase (DUF442 family)